MFFSDKPIESKNDDLLNRKGFARLLAQTLVRLDSADTFTVGLFGKWGCGKTSLVNMTLAEVEAMQEGKTLEEQIVVVHFEPWNFTDTNQLLTQFFVRMANEFQKRGDKTLTEIGKAMEKYSDAFGILEIIPAVGTPLASLGKWSISHIGKEMQRDLDDCDVLKQKEQVIRLLKEQKSRILVVLDDIDRLSDEQIRYIFQLITSVARFPNTTYLLVFDKEIVVKALKDVQSGNGEDYLEKVIQIPIQIPDIRRTDLRNVLFNRLEGVKDKFEGIGYSHQHWQRLFAPCVEPFVKNLRDINRLSNALLFKLTSIASEVDFTDMITLSLIEIHHPLIYEWIKNNKAILTGESDYSALGNSNTQKQWNTHYSEQLQRIIQMERAGVAAADETKTVMKTLTNLFPYFASRVGSSSSDANDMAYFSRHNLVAHPNKFDRYFYIDGDNVVYKTTDVQNIIWRMTKEEIVSFLLLQDKHSASYELLEDIKARITELSGERAKVLASALFNAISSLKQTKQRSWLSVSAGSFAEDMMLALIERIPGQERLTFLSEFMAVADKEVMPPVARVINRMELGYGRLAAEGKMRTEYRRVITQEELLVLEERFSKRVKEMLEHISLFDFSEWRMIHYLVESFDPEFMNDYLNRALFVDENILKFLDNFVVPWIGTGTRYEVERTYTKYITLDRVFESIMNCQKDGTFFALPEEIQRKCAAFFMIESGEAKGGVNQDDVDQVIAAWKAMSHANGQ